MHGFPLQLARTFNHQEEEIGDTISKLIFTSRQARFGAVPLPFTTIRPTPLNAGLSSKVTIAVKMENEIIYGRPLIFLNFTMTASIIFDNNLA